MKSLCQRFPHLSKSILNNCDNQSLIKSKEASREIFEFLENERFYWIRIIQRKYLNFEGFEESWKEAIHQTPFDVIKELENELEKLFSLQNPCSGWIRPIHPLHVAALQGNLKLYEYIVAKAKDKIPQGRLFCKYENNEGIQFLIPTTGEGSNYQMVKGATPLHMAAMNGNLEVCKYISKNSNHEDQQYNLKETPLDIAAANGHFEVVKILFESFGGKHQRHSFGCTPLHYAAARGHIEIYQYLQQNVVDKNPSGQLGITPLHLAANFGHLNVFKVVGHNININPGNDYGSTPLHYAAEKNQLEICRFIIGKVDNKNPAANNNGLNPLNDGKTPLHLAAKNGCFEICKLIIANVSTKHPLNNNGQSPRDLVDKYNQSKTRSNMLELFDN